VVVVVQHFLLGRAQYLGVNGDGKLGHSVIGKSGCQKSNVIEEMHWGRERETRQGGEKTIAPGLRPLPRAVALAHKRIF
jgi:hypothetical protein